MNLPSHTAELETSTAIVASECSRRGEAVSLFVLDGNLLIDSPDGLKFLPLTVPMGVAQRLFELGILHFDISDSAPDDQTRAFLHALSQEDGHQRIFAPKMYGRDRAVTAIAFSYAALPEAIRSRSRSWHDACLGACGACNPIVISLHQPGYLRHLGFYAKLAQSHVFGIEDSLQYCKQEWQNRQRFNDPDGRYQWLTVPIAHTGSDEPIAAKLIAQDFRWRRRHWNVLRERFAKSPYFAEISPFFRELYRRDWWTLRSLAEATTRHTAILLGLEYIAQVRTSALDITPGKKGHAIADFIRAILPGSWGPPGASRRVVYLAGPDSGYLAQRDTSGKPFSAAIRAEGIEIRYQDVFDSRSGVLPQYGHETAAAEVLFREGMDGARAVLRYLTAGDCTAGACGA